MVNLLNEMCLQASKPLVVFQNEILALWQPGKIRECRSDPYFRSDSYFSIPPECKNKDHFNIQIFLSAEQTARLPVFHFENPLLTLTLRNRVGKLVHRKSVKINGGCDQDVSV